MSMDKDELFDYGRAALKARDAETAINYFRQAAELGDYRAMIFLGEIYFTGCSVDLDPPLDIPHDYEESAKWFRMAVAAGEASARCWLWKVLLKQDDPAHYDELLDCLHKEAERTDDHWHSMVAMEQLGELYEAGKIVPQDYDEAEKWYLHAAELADADDTDAILELARFYKVRRNDYANAAKWYRRAVELGDEEAQGYLDSLPEVPDHAPEQGTSAPDVDAMPRIFVSYAKADQEQVRPLIERMKQEGYRVWYDGKLGAGSDWFGEIAEHIQQADFVLAFLSETAVNSEFFRNEIEFAISENKALLPVCLSEITLPGRMNIYLGNCQFINLYAMDEDAFFERLRGILLNQPQPEPSKPDLSHLHSYDGTEPYIFVSYAHANKEEVLPIIARMQQDGYRVWFDEGIDPGTEWDDNIAAHLEDCAVMLSFLTEEYLNSDNCKDELNFARDLGKKMLLVYLTPIQLPRGMALRLGRNQAIHQYTYEDQTEFFAKLYSAPVLDAAKD